MKPKLICLLGPTAVGKTEIAIELANHLNAEIVSVDSRQIYRHLDIGTAKPTHEQQNAVPHHLIDCVDIAEPFSAADYQRLADTAIVDIQKRGKISLLVGGAGLYFRAIVDGLFQGPGADTAIRERLQREAAHAGPELLHNRLCSCDADAAARIHPNNVVRVIRALEIYELTGTPISQLQQQWNHQQIDKPPRYPFTAFCLSMSRAYLYQRIEQRVDLMMTNGLIEEVKGVLTRGYPRDSIALQSFGYRELIAYLEQECPLNEAIVKVKQNTRRFAKRQLTWFRKDSRLEWVERGTITEVVAHLLARAEHI